MTAGTMDTLVILVIVGWITLVLLKSAKNKTDYRMKWFYFYTYFLLPFWAIDIFAEFYNMGNVATLPLWFVVWTLGLIALIVAVFAGFYNRSLWGYYLNWVLLAVTFLIKILFYPISNFEKEPEHFIAYLLAGLVCTVLNVLYFRKRKVLFT